MRRGSEERRAPGRKAAVDWDREAAESFSVEELQEFVEGGFPEVDPAFKERLRQSLWEFLRSRRRP